MSIIGRIELYFCCTTPEPPKDYLIKKPHEAREEPALQSLSPDRGDWRDTEVIVRDI